MIAARPGVDDSLCVCRGGEGDRRLLLAVLDGRVTAYSKQATAKFKKQRLGAQEQIGNLETVRAKRTRAAGMSLAARALRSDVVRRAASRGGTLRCAEARRVAYRDVDKSYASHRLS